MVNVFLHLQMYIRAFKTAYIYFCIDGSIRVLSIANRRRIFILDNACAVNSPLTREGRAGRRCLEAEQRSLMVDTASSWLICSDDLSQDDNWPSISCQGEALQYIQATQSWRKLITVWWKKQCFSFFFLMLSQDGYWNSPVILRLAVPIVCLMQSKVSLKGNDTTLEKFICRGNRIACRNSQKQ